MSAESPSPASAALGQLKSVASAGAEGAAKALALLVGCSVAHRQRGAPAQGTSPREYHRATGIFFEVNGDLGGGVALLLGPESRDRVVRSFLGVGREGDIDPDTAFSAVCELGNIVASRAISAVADTLGARILLSLPNLATESAEVVLERWITERRRHGPVLHFEIELADIEGSFQALLVFVLDPPDRRSLGRLPGV